MPRKDKGDIDLTIEQAKKNIRDHEDKHGRDMDGPPGHSAGHDSPTDDDMKDNGPPDWHESKGGKGSPKGWRKEADGSFTMEDDD